VDHFEFSRDNSGRNDDFLRSLDAPERKNGGVVRRCEIGFSTTGWSCKISRF